ncbi:MFS transporter [Sporosarcina thermotolerans]|uniref:MFS transporter n=1 Tax=Sporosarcina thermotolerans TaxID=633404 RepID=A0AAW9A8V5_9BACL|nr:MFS transporter [Sporosarcina thermotolerans]MDW0117479.1 MFS transporter [Sporosarcina thermotolerans]WHT49654.1 MFS transporter [Sporosarcina thermotolerans]
MKKTNARWLVVALLFVATTINYMDRAILGVAGPAMMEDLSLTPVQFGLLGSAFFWSYALMQIPVGMIVDRLGARLTYSIAIVWWSLCTIFTGFGRSLGALIGIRVLMGIGEAPAFPTNTRVISDWLPSHERGIANGIFNSGTAIGIGMSTPLLAWVIQNWGWQAAFVVVGAIGFIWLAFWLIYFKNQPKDSTLANEAEVAYIKADESETEKAPALNISPFKLLKFKNVYPLLYGLFAHNYLTYLMMTWLPIYLVTERDMNLINAGFFTMLPWIMSFFGNILGGFLSDGLIKRGWNSIKARKTILGIGMLFPLLLIPTIFAESAVMAIVYISIAIGGEGIAAGILWATVSDVAPKGAEGKLAGLQNFIGNLAGWIAPVATGVLVAKLNNFDIALIIPVIICLVASVGYLFVLKNERISIDEDFGKGIKA